MLRGAPLSYVFDPIGVVRSPLVERAAAPRQPNVADEASRADARIELYPGRGFEDALEGVEAWRYLWILFVFHLNVEQGRGWRPKVRPPRADDTVGLFATRSPHRPNPIGMSAVALDRVEGLTIYVRDVDLLDGTPVLDLKPYVPYADARPDAGDGWLARDPEPPWRVTFDLAAAAQLAWLRQHGVDLEAAIATALALGPQPHAYRRIRPHGEGLRLALKEWRVDFTVNDDVRKRAIVVHAVASGYRPRDRDARAELAVHRAYCERFPGEPR